MRDGKGGKDRVTMLPEPVVQPLQAHFGRVRALHQRDLSAGYGQVSLPFALARKYPRAASQARIIEVSRGVRRIEAMPSFATGSC